MENRYIYPKMKGKQKCHKIKDFNKLNNPFIKNTWKTS